MAAEVFAVPELAAMLTSKALNRIFNPYFWKNTSVLNDTEREQWEIYRRASRSGFLHKHRHHIETLRLEIFAAEYLHALLDGTSSDDVTTAPSALAQTPIGTSPHPGFSSLKSVSIAVGAVLYSQLSKKDAVIPDSALNRLLESAPNITCLTLYPEVLESTKFMTILETGLHHLQTLILTPAPELWARSFALSSPLLSALPVLFAKPNLTTLELDFPLIREDSPALVTKAMKDLAGSPKSKSAITSIVFPGAKDLFTMAFVKPLLESCLPQLQILNVPSVGVQELAQLTDIVQDHCPNVRELNLARLYIARDPPAMKEQIVHLIMSCEDLRVFHGPPFDREGYLWAITQALLHHANTLESVTLAEKMGSSDFASLISSMRALRTLIVFRGGRTEVEGAISMPWACRHLRKLEWTIEEAGLDLDPEFNPGLPSERLGGEDLGNVAMRKLFKNIGELTELEDLCLKHCCTSRWKFEKDWTLGGGLGFLGGLVNLRKLRLDYGLDHIGQAEVEFMYKHWPNLQEVVFEMVETQVDQYRLPWEWLKSCRPDLKYTFETYPESYPSSDPDDPSDNFLYCGLEGY
ncbi:hypothetical protein BGZ70_005911 [Mortierella alpina]|uniref:Uncharacterized protein n=1 Tax=Mortierella alpina TaxID=64518 RepID=A0A9P6J8L5_MORAP|nr:hypothetical protein BGZ70_005911 [Mortierella alpina]